MNAPRTWPNSSERDQLVRERAAVDDDERALRARGERWCTASASASLPVPVSPSSSTVASVAARLEQREQLLHRLRGAEHVAEAIARRSRRR